MNRAARRAAARQNPRPTATSERRRIAQVIAEQDTLHRWDTVNGVDMLTVFTANEVVMVASDTDNEVQAFLAVSRYVGRDGSTALNHAPIANAYEALVNRFPKKPMPRSTQKAWDALPATEMRSAQALRIMRSAEERVQRAKESAAADAEHMTLAERRIAYRYKWNDSAQQPERTR